MATTRSDHGGGGRARGLVMGGGTLTSEQNPCPTFSIRGIAGGEDSHGRVVWQESSTTNARRIRWTRSKEVRQE